MIDIHSHILPGIDDGAANVNESLIMLRECMRQGVETVFATPHFYADSDDPQHFIKKRNRAYETLLSAKEQCSFEFPDIICGAEVYYFPGMSSADELSELTLGDLPFILIEPPMMPWTEGVLDEIEETGNHLRCIPIIAHIDRYMKMLNDYSLIQKVQNRRMLVQVNTNFFLDRNTKAFAVRCLCNKMFQFIGTDCHNLTDRPPNMRSAVQEIKAAGAIQDFANFVKKEYLVFEIG